MSAVDFLSSYTQNGRHVVQPDEELRRRLLGQQGQRGAASGRVALPKLENCERHVIADNLNLLLTFDPAMSIIWRSPQCPASSVEY